MQFSPWLKDRLEKVELKGIEPKEWVVADGGVSREELKSFYLEQGIAFVSSAIQDVPSLCSHLLGPLVEKERILSGSSRQELLREILSDRIFSESLPEVRRLKRQRDFYRKLDRTVQNARLTYASREELEAQEERLREKGIISPLRNEMLKIISAYESALSERHLWDLPRLLLAATGVLQTLEIPISLPERLWVLSLRRGESRLEAFFEALAPRTEVNRLFLVNEETIHHKIEELRWERWHTVDDAAEALADRLLDSYSKGESLTTGVVIPDVPSVRRSFSRALSRRGLLLRDPRDPTRLKVDEAIKTALLPLEVVARGYQHSDVLSFLHSNWVRLDSDSLKEFEGKRAIEQEVLDRGIRRGLTYYSGEKLERLRAFLDLLHEAFSPRLSIEQVSSFHLAWIRKNPDFLPWVSEFFESVWNKFSQDLRVVGGMGRRVPLLYWVERLRQRLGEATPPYERVQYLPGVELFRLGQVPLRYPNRLYALALPPRYTTVEQGGDYFISDREREKLGSHFSVYSSAQNADFRKQSLQIWFHHAREVVFLESTYDWDGREQESLDPLLRELGLLEGREDLRPVECDGYPRWSRGYLHPQTSPPRSFDLGEWGLPGQRPQISASALENFSRCELQGVLLGRWKLRELKESDLELRGDSRGTLLHAAVRILIESRDSSGNIGKTPLVALEEAWKSERPKGLFQGEKLSRFTQERLLPILETFVEEEKKYFDRSQTEVLALEGPVLNYFVELGVGDDRVEIRGRPDRIDRHRDGIFLIDYKTSSDAPAARQMLEHGYRLQLPLYALAAARHFDLPALGFQFIALNREGSRSRGLFFKQWNGKEKGNLTQTTARNASLVDQTPDEVWGRFAEEIDSHIRRLLSGKVRVEPKQAKTGGVFAECESCFVRDACGQRRFLDDSSNGEEND